MADVEWPIPANAVNVLELFAEESRDGLRRIFVPMENDSICGPAPI
jgi:hypothetical protein